MKLNTFQIVQLGNTPNKERVYLNGQEVKCCKSYSITKNNNDDAIINITIEADKIETLTLEELLEKNRKQKELKKKIDKIEKLLLNGGDLSKID